MARATPAGKASTPARPRRRRVASQTKAVAHLIAADPVLARVIEEVGELPDFREGRPDPGDHYGALVRAIVGQQLSVLATHTGGDPRRRP